MIEEKTRVVFTGDIAFSGFFCDGWRGEGCLNLAIKDYLNEADYVVGNIECPLANREIISDRKLNHVGNPVSGRYLEEIGVKTWDLANNHIMDCGIDGLKDTLKVANDNNCHAIGAGRNLKESLNPIIIGDIIKIGVLCVASAKWSYVKADKNTEGVVTWDKTDYLRMAISSLRQDVDWIVLVVHGGDEYCDIALPSVRKEYHTLLDLGADIIVGHHPHVIQNYERVGNKIIFYSLGNFIFDTENQRKFVHTDTGMLVGLNFWKDRYTFDSIAVHIDREQQIVRQGETPPVFCEINENEYSRLWPLAAKMFYPIDLKNRKTFSARLQAANPVLLFCHEVYMCRHKREREIQLGRIISLARKWKNTSMRELCNYLKLVCARQLPLKNYQLNDQRQQRPD